MPPPCASLPRERGGRGWRECAPRNNTTGQCKHRRGKPTMRLDPERPPPGLPRAPTRAAHTLPPPPPRVYVRMCVRWSDPADRAGRPDRDRAYAPEIALNGRTKALNNAAIISDGVLPIRARLFNILSRGAGAREDSDRRIYRYMRT